MLTIGNEGVSDVTSVEQKVLRLGIRTQHTLTLKSDKVNTDGEVDLNR